MWCQRNSSNKQRNKPKIFLLHFDTKKNVNKRFDFSFYEMLFFTAPFSFFFTSKRLWWNDFLFTIKTPKWWSALKWKFSIVTKWKKKKIKVNTFRWRGSVQVKNDRLKNSNKNIPTLRWWRRRRQWKKKPRRRQQCTKYISSTKSSNES